MSVQVMSRLPQLGQIDMANQINRLRKGGLIDRNKPLHGLFDGQPVAGFAGDTLASALLASGIRLIGRSFKYHRPRGLVTAGPDEPNALVELREGGRQEPNTKATTLEFFDNLVASSQNRWPSLRFDILSMISVLSPFLPAGFYYKTFKWPSAFWESVYEPLIRRAAGLGRLSSMPDPDSYEQQWAFCDVLIIGAGPTGLMAALSAARSGARVIVCDEDFEFGGELLSRKVEIAGDTGAGWARNIVDELRSNADVRLLTRTTVFGAYDGGTFGALERVADHRVIPRLHEPRQRLWRIIAQRAVLAAGALERSIVFSGNDRPGVMTASAMREYTNRFAVTAGRRVAIFTNNNDGWRAASDLRQAGIDVVAIVDSRADVAPSLAAGLSESRIFLGGTVVGTTGRTSLRRIAVSHGLKTEWIDVDALGVSGGWNPNVHLDCHLGKRPVWSETLAAFVPGEALGVLYPAGAARGRMELSHCLEEGALAGKKAAEDLGFGGVSVEVPAVNDETYSVSALWNVSGRSKDAFVDFQNDVTAADVALAEQEGYRSVEHLKRYTTLGMGTDQGKLSNLNGLALMSELSGRSIPETGTTTYRAPYTPVSIAAFAGAHRGKNFRPTRCTPSHRWAEANGAVFVEAGAWLRAQYFPRAGEHDWFDAAIREVNTVRNCVGFCDVSTLGKIEIQGDNAATFLDRIYINTFSTLPVGRARYGLMLREDGFVLDDGTTARLADKKFFMTTTTANAGRVFQHLQYCHQVLWPELDVQFVSATDQWAQYSVAGPRARDVLSAIVDLPFDIRNEAFPYMHVAEITVCGGTPARLYRLSFSGELAYEIGVPAGYGHSLAQALMQVGERYSIAPYGTEALSIMRIEKGHVAGPELDGRTTATDLGLGRMISSKKDFIGRVLSGRKALLDPNRPCLTGLKPVDRAQRLQSGAHLLPRNAPVAPESEEGVVTSVAFSPSLGHWIGLGFLTRAGERLGERICATDLLRKEIVEVEVCAPVFIDPEGKRLRA